MLRSSHALVVLLLAAPFADAQSPTGRTLAATRIATAPDIDGRLTDSVWGSIAPVADFAQHRPVPGAPSTQHTEVRLAYDDDALYIAVRAHDTAGDSVVARLARRDQAVYSEWFTVLIDSYHDRRTAYAFAVNPRGVQRDYVIANDVEEDATWDAVWEASARTDAAGWTAELRIPLAQLRFRAPGASELWGVNFARLIARRDELAYWSPVAPDRPGLVSQFGTLAGIVGLRPGRRVEVAPYTLARAARAPGDAADPFHRATTTAVSAGADLEVGLGAGLTLSATLNPDFGQVEADPSEVNLRPEESFFDEQRPFFTEGAELFGGGFPRLVYSRRIGAAPRGAPPRSALYREASEQTTILGAAKLTGRAGGWALGILDAVTARETVRWSDASGLRGEQVVEPMANYLGARARRDFDSGRSALGFTLGAVNRGDESGLITPRIGQAYSGGVDGRKRFGGDYQVAGHVTGSRIAGSSRAITLAQRAPIRAFQRPDADHLAVDSTRTSMTGFAARMNVARIGGRLRWDAGITTSSPGFDVNDLGFQPQADLVRQWVDVRWERFAPAGAFRSWSVGTGFANAWTYGRERTDGNVMLQGRGQLRNYWSGSMMVMRYASALDKTVLRGGPALRGERGTSGSISLQSDARRPIRADFDVAVNREDVGGGAFTGAGMRLAARPSTTVEVSLRPLYTVDVTPAQFARTLVGPAPTYVVSRLEQRTASLTLRADYTMTPALSLQLYAEPFVSAGDYDGARGVANAGARTYAARFRELTDREQDAVGTASGDFTVRSLRSNAVLRWEYRPGSTLFVVWGQARDQRAGTGRLDLWRDARAVTGAPGTNVLMVKASYWIGR